MASTTQVDVCIVGGGPAGLVLANLLAGRGLDTLVLEINPDFEREFRGEVLQPRFMRAMRQVGLDAFILDQPHERFDHARIYNHGKTIGAFRFDRIDREFPYAIWMTQPVMLSALHERARRFPSYDLWFGAKAHGLLMENGRAAGVAVHRNGQEVEVGRAWSLVQTGGSPPYASWPTSPPPMSTIRSTSCGSTSPGPPTRRIRSASTSPAMRRT